MKFVFCLITLSVLNGVVDAHFVLSDPTARAMDFNPVPGNEKGIDDEKFVCGGHNIAGTPNEQTNKINAGETRSVKMVESPANHCGDCAAYISYDVNLPIIQQKYFLIARAKDYIVSGSTLGPADIIFPTWLPSGSIIFRWQCFTLHQGPPEFYAQCADMTVTSAIPEGGPLPPTYTIVGHMPKTGYGSCTNIVHDLGPPIATQQDVGGGGAGGATTSSPTASPTTMVATPPATSPTAPATSPTVPATSPTARGTAPTPTTSPVDCINHPGEDANCETLIANQRDICSTNNDWMRVKCSFSCGVCVDQDVDPCKPDQSAMCRTWASENQCFENSYYMKNNCPKSCGYCFPSCKPDQDVTCPTRVREGQCLDNPEYMRNNCPESCGYCLPSTPVNVNPDSSGLQIKVAGSLWLLLVLCLIDKILMLLA